MKIFSRSTPAAFHLVALALLSVAGSISHLRAQSPGSLDPTFGNGGRVDPGTGSEIYSLALQMDGKIVGGGYLYVDASHRADFAVGRFNADGTLDASFGTGGISALNFDIANGQDTADIVTGIVVQSDGKILAAGYSYDPAGYLDNGNGSLALARFNADGTPDTGFGSGGKIKSPLSNGYRFEGGSQGASPGNYISSIILQPDGKFVVGCTGLATADPVGAAFILQRYNPDGSLDASFGSGGSVATFFPSPTAGSQLDRLVLQPDGRIIAVGTAQLATAQGNTYSNGVLVRYNADGSPDGSFGNNGQVLLADGNTTYYPAFEITDAQIDPDGKIIATGLGYNPDNGRKTTLVRLNADGTRDTSFGTNGIAVSPTVSPLVHPTVRRQTDGKYLVGTTVEDNNYDFSSARYNADGSVDSTYGQGGRIAFDFHGSVDRAYAMLLQPDGKLVLGGTATYNGNPQFGLTRQLTAGASHPAFFGGEVALGNGVYYLTFPGSGNPFGYYSYLTDPKYVYHFDLGYEYVFDANDGQAGVYLYDFKSNGFLYTSPGFSFPYLYDFSLDSVLYYYPDPNNAGHYNTNGVRYFYEFSTGKIISK